MPGTPEWIYARIVAEIALHHSPDVVLALLKVVRHPVKKLVIVASAAGAGYGIYKLIQHSQQKEAVPNV